MLFGDKVTITCNNCSTRKTYKRADIPKICESCGEPFERGQFGRDWYERVQIVAAVVCLTATGVGATNSWLLAATFPSIGLIFSWQFSINVGIFIILCGAVGSFLRTSSNTALFLVKQHARLTLFLIFFVSSVISIPVTVYLTGTLLDWGNLIIGIESNIIASFLFVALYEMLIQRRLPRTSK